MYDLIVRNGTIVDGTGAPPALGDVGVKDGRIVHVGRRIDADADEVIDATGRLVTPGFVDIHTHYDGQVTWDPLLEPSTLHGVTTLVMGNCGVGFAPVRPGTEEWLIQLMEGVEDIPGAALSEGMQWQWESFPEYLDALARKPLSVDVATQIPHAAVRAYVMGELGARNEPATDDDIAAMRDIVREAIEAGAFGFTTSRTLAHRAKDGVPVPGTFADEAELMGIGDAELRGFDVTEDGADEGHGSSLAQMGLDAVSATESMAPSRRSRWSSVGHGSSRGTVPAATASAAAVPAAWPMAMHWPIERTAAWASWVALKQRPQASTFCASRTSSVR